MRKPQRNPEKRHAPKDRKIVINCEPWETRVAYVEGDRISEFYVERDDDKRTVGNIYKGRVVRVLPGMQAAFVDIGLERTAFLYVSEIVDDMSSLMSSDNQDLEISESELRGAGYRGQQIQDLLKEGQDVLVQITKDPIGTKGARLTCHITLPGRNVVLMPTMNHIGISRRIPSDRERRRLRDLAMKMKRRDEGIIIRTSSEGVPSQLIKSDIQYLQNLWTDIQKKSEKLQPPSLVYGELNLALRSIRDMLSGEVVKIIIDDPKTHGEIMDFLKDSAPQLEQLVELYRGEQPIFDAYNLEQQLARAMEKKVWLHSGGYLIIEQTEALAAIDVNTGRFVGGKNLEDTILKTNLEAIDEIVQQLRLRDIGGIIILDFIDMDRAADREKVYRALEEALKNDKARTNISKITSLGLVEMTRKRTQENISMALTEPCVYCEGTGRVKSHASITCELYRAIQRDVKRVQGNTIIVNAHPEVVKFLNHQERENLKILEERLGKQILISRDVTLHIEDFEIHG